MNTYDDRLDPLSGGWSALRASASAIYHRVEAAIDGDRGIYAEVRAESARTASLLRDVRSADEPERRWELLQQARRAMTATHLAIEQELFPLLSGIGALTTHVECHAQSQAGIDRQLAALANVDPASASFADTLDLVIARFTDHVDRLESELFPRAKRHLSGEAAQLAGERFVAAHRGCLNAFEQASAAPEDDERP